MRKLVLAGVATAWALALAAHVAAGAAKEPNVNVVYPFVFYSAGAK